MKKFIEVARLKRSEFSHLGKWYIRMYVKLALQDINFRKAFDPQG
jgi:hypothetical protein